MIQDSPDFRRVLQRDTVYRGKIWDVISESIELAPGTTPFSRDYIDHPGAVAVVALDEADRILLIRQYRHPARSSLWEIPAGLLDIDGEDFQAAAARELAEEADLQAADWRVLADIFNSPGSSSEAVRIFLARGISAVPAAQRHIRTDEEAEIQLSWVPLTEAAQAVLSGGMHNASAIIGVLAAAAALASPDGLQSLRPADAPWPEHPSQHPLP